LVPGAPITPGEQVQMIEIVFGIVLTVISPNDASVDPASVIYKGLITTGKIVEKTEKKEWEASAHEEIYQMTKDSIYKMGGLK